MRIILQLVMVLSGLLLAREFMPHSNEHRRLVLRWASIVSENIAAVHEAPASVAPVAVGPIAEVSAQSIAIVRDAPALVITPLAIASIAEVSTQSISTVHDEPPGLLTPRALAQIAQVSAQSIATVRKPPALVATEDVDPIAQVSPKHVANEDSRPALVVANDFAQIAEVSPKTFRSVDIRPAHAEVAPIASASVGSIDGVQARSALAPSMEIAQIGGEAAQRLTPSHERLQQLITSAPAQTAQVSAHSIVTVRDEPPRQLAPTAVAPIPEVSMQSLVIADEAPVPVAPMSACERIWDQMTHMSRDEWAEACRRVDALRLVVRNDTSLSGER